MRTILIALLTVAVLASSVLRVAHAHGVGPGQATAAHVGDAGHVPGEGESPSGEPAHCDVCSHAVGYGFAVHVAAAPSRSAAIAPIGPAILPASDLALPVPLEPPR